MNWKQSLPQQIQRIHLFLTMCHDWNKKVPFS
jgi:hypothetical protein